MDDTVVLSDQKSKAFSKNIQKEKEILNFLRLINILTVHEGAFLFHIVGYQEAGKLFHEYYKTVAPKLGCNEKTIKRSVQKLQHQYQILGETRRCGRAKKLYIQSLEKWAFLIPLIKAKVESSKKPFADAVMFLQFNEHITKNSDIILPHKQDIVIAKENKRKRWWSEGTSVRKMSPQECAQMSPQVRVDVPSITNIDLNYTNNNNKEIFLERIMERQNTPIFDSDYASLVNSWVGLFGKNGFDKLMVAFSAPDVPISDNAYLYVFAYGLKTLRNGSIFTSNEKMDKSSIRDLKNKCPGLKLFWGVVTEFMNRDYRYGHTLKNLSCQAENLKKELEIKEKQRLMDIQKEQEEKRHYEDNTSLYWNKALQYYTDVHEHRIDQYPLPKVVSLLFKHAGLGEPVKDLEAFRVLFKKHMGTSVIPWPLNPKVRPSNVSPYFRDQSPPEEIQKRIEEIDTRNAFWSKYK